MLARQAPRAHAVVFLEQITSLPHHPFCWCVCVCGCKCGCLCGCVCVCVCVRVCAPSPTLSPTDPVPRGLLPLCPAAY